MADNGITVVIDTHLTEALIEEGFVREIISKIQTMRKDAGFDVTDHIVVYEKGNDRIAKIISDNLASIQNDVLAEEVRLNEMAGFAKEWDLNGEAVELGVQKI